jgi:hypothetical protein
MFMRGLKVMFPDLDSTEIESAHINRATKVQPLQVLDYSQLVPTAKTLHPDFFVLNTAQFSANTLNNNEVIRAVDEFVDAHASEFSRDASPEKISGVLKVSNYAEQAI